MKMVTAIIKPFRLDDVRDALSDIGIKGIKIVGIGNGGVAFVRQVAQLIECVHKVGPIAGQLRQLGRMNVIQIIRTPLFRADDAIVGGRIALQTDISVIPVSLQILQIMIDTVLTIVGEHPL